MAAKVGLAPSGVSCYCTAIHGARFRVQARGSFLSRTCGDGLVKIASVQQRRDGKLRLGVTVT